MATTTNLPWIKQPVGYMQNNEFHVLFDGYDIASNDTRSSSVEFTYIKKPNMFTLDGQKCDFGNTVFELSDSAAEELINLAIIFASDTVESPRLNTKVNLRSFES